MKLHIMDSERQDEKLCEACDKKNQKEIPDAEILNGEMRCKNTYEEVAKCMDLNKGQISKCKDEWDEFRKCHSKTSIN